MGVQDDTEKVLRALHVMLAKGEQYPKEPSKVIVDKQQMLDLLSALNQCMYQMQEKYELTKSSRDKAERDFRKQGDTIIMDASHKAEDIYAASVMYMDEALNHMRDIMKESNENVSKIYADLNEKMDIEFEKALEKVIVKIKNEKPYAAICDEISKVPFPEGNQDEDDDYKEEDISCDDPANWDNLPF